MIPIRDRNPTDLFPVVTIAIIIANIAVFVYQLSYLAQGPKAFEHFVMSFAVIPSAFFNNPASPSQYASIFTSMFLHGGLLHIAGNMLFLWIFGNNVEDYFGHFKFALFYLLCGVAGALGHIFAHPESTVPTIGASGAISGVLGAYFILFPKARVVALVPVFLFFYFLEVPAFVFLGIYILFQFLYGIPSLSAAPEAAQGVAWFAHIGGFFAGLILIFIFGKRRGFRKRIPR
ncbi:MAG: rhomboid family intramembrane serine protease [Candidatus Abyssubacteria bacterium]